jgi:uncharacterized membrane protein
VLVRSHRDLAPALVSVALGAVVGAVLLALHASFVLAALSAWDAGATLFLGIFWFVIAQKDALETHRRAASEDPGRSAVYGLVLLGSGASLVSAVALVRNPDEAHKSLLIALCLANVALSWSLTQAVFTLRYAHLYYRDDDEGVGGIDFPGDAAPAYFEFAYLAFTVGTTFQVSDTAVSSSQVRRAVLLHAALSFVYNTAILAFVLNLLFGLAGH